MAGQVLVMLHNGDSFYYSQLVNAAEWKAIESTIESRWPRGSYNLVPDMPDNSPVIMLRADTHALNPCNKTISLRELGHQHHICDDPKAIAAWQTLAKINCFPNNYIGEFNLLQSLKDFMVKM